jgi:signal transduction histidine kinase/DNA-binding response OmpR family regulator/ligand-binding sensor domain-containing protein
MGVPSLNMQDSFKSEFASTWADIVLAVISQNRQLQKQLIFILLCILRFSSPSFAQIQESGEFITTEHGLSQGLVFDIIQDDEGFLWFATLDGLNRYDGYTFKAFTNDPQDPESISANLVTKLFIDSSSRLWAITPNAGINIYNKHLGKFQRIYHDPTDANSLSGNSVASVVEIAKDEFIVAVENRVINRFTLDESFLIENKNPKVEVIELPDQEQLEHADKSANSNSKLKGIVKDLEGRIWVGGMHSFYKFDINTRSFSLTAENYTFNHGVVLKNGLMILGGINDPTISFDGVNIHPMEDELSNSTDITINKDGTVSITNWEYTFELNTPQFSQNKSTILPISTLAKKCVFKDNSGIYWIGTNGYGIIKYNPAKLNFDHKLIGNSISGIFPLPGEKLICKSNTGQVFDLEGKAFDFKVFGIPSRDVLLGDVLLLKNGNVIIKGEIENEISGVEKWIFFVDPSNQKTSQIEAPWHLVSQKMVEGIKEDIWILSQDGLVIRIDASRSKLEMLSLQDGNVISDEAFSQLVFNHKMGTAIHYDNNVLWLGYESGFYKCELDPFTNDISKVKKYSNVTGDNYSLSNNYVTHFMNDPIFPDKYMWICTRGGGLNKFDIEAETFERFTTKDGLPNDVVYGVLNDQFSNLWGSTNKGIFCLSQKNTFEEKIEYNFRNFNSTDGLQESEFNTNSFRKLSDNKLAFGGINGLNIFDPKQILTEEFIPPVFITKLMVDNKEILPSDDTKLLDKDILFTEEIELTHLQDILSIEFASLDFNNPAINKYRHRLKPIDKEWVETGTSRSATYLHLPTGNYTFELQGSNSHSIWNDKTTYLKINVLPPWWLTWWAFLMYSVFGTFLFWQYYKFITTRAKLNQQLVFEKSESEKAKELDLLKTRLYTNLTHEFRTPLTIIIGMVDQIKGSTEQNMAEGLDMIKRNGENLLQLVNRMLDLSKIESGKMVLDARQGDIIQTLKNVSDSFVGYAANKDIVIHFLSDMDQKNMIYDDEKIRHIFSNLISNAIKFTLAGGNIYVSVRQQENDLLLKVKDTGKGILPDQLDKVFDRFYQIESEDNRTSEGTGIGLALCKELVFLMNGKISVQSPPTGSDHGSEFIVLLPTTGALQDLNPIGRSAHNINADAFTSNVQRQTVAKAPSLIPEIQTSAHKEDEKVILLVEDNADIVAYVASCLRDYKLIVATNGVEGLEMAVEAIPDLIVSDVMMPIMDGFEMCKRIKQDTRTNHIPVVILTAKADLESKIEGLEYGANAYLSKPFDTDELLLTIRNLFRLRRQLQAHYRVGFNKDEVVDPIETIEEVTSPKLDEFVIEVREKIESRIADFGLSVEDLAKDLHFSQSQFSRKLNAVIGMTPVKYIRQIRLEKAKGMLKDPTLSIIVIAYDCGFSDPSYFTRVFKKEFGAPPLEWREKNEED